jgi:hypothetical protein
MAGAQPTAAASGGSVGSGFASPSARAADGDGVVGGVLLPGSVGVSVAGSGAGLVGSPDVGPAVGVSLGSGAVVWLGDGLGTLVSVG